MSSCNLMLCMWNSNCSSEPIQRNGCWKSKILQCTAPYWIISFQEHHIIAWCSCQQHSGILYIAEAAALNGQVWSALIKVIGKFLSIFAWPCNRNAPRAAWRPKRTERVYDELLGWMIHSSSSSAVFEQLERSRSVYLIYMILISS